MGNRISKVYTRTGDDGKTGLGDGTRIEKDALRIETIGTIDELNSCLGIVLAEDLPENIRNLLLRIQNELFDFGGELCLPGQNIVTSAHVTALERDLDAINQNLPPLKEFILPGGPRAAASCQLARSICRRGERRLVRLSRAEEVNPHAMAYLNRLSDLLFVIARHVTLQAGGTETLWQHPRKDTI